MGEDRTFYSSHYSELGTLELGFRGLGAQISSDKIPAQGQRRRR